MSRIQATESCLPSHKRSSTDYLTGRLVDALAISNYSRGGEMDGTESSGAP